MIDATFDEVSRAAMPWRCGCERPDAPIWNQPRAIRFAPMTAAIFRRDLFEEIGPLGRALRAHIWKTWTSECDARARDVPAFTSRPAVARHMGSATLGPWNKDTVALAARNQILLVRKHLRGTPWGPVLAGQLLWGLNAVRHRRGWSFIKGKLRGLRDSKVRKAAGNRSTPLPTPASSRSSNFNAKPALTGTGGLTSGSCGGGNCYLELRKGNRAVHRIDTERSPRLRVNCCG